jgi:hypothetical protein
MNLTASAILDIFLSSENEMRDLMIQVFFIFKSKEFRKGRLKISFQTAFSFSTNQMRR